ncbi:MAG: hypothetical protein FWD54_03890 [Endomicrobia bacterium]|nr:hypothetical protein [Endomicrobiia bacterium]MCL2799398.1 hypothetical protein [Endomicrobiia bacterium]
MKKIALLVVVAVFVLLAGVSTGYSQTRFISAGSELKDKATSKEEQEKAEREKKTLEMEEKRRKVKENYVSAKEDLQIKLAKSMKDKDIAKKDKNTQLEQKREKDIAYLKKQMAILQRNYEQEMKQFE